VLEQHTILVAALACARIVRANRARRDAADIGKQLVVE
jgi:hypothetical protein